MSRASSQNRQPLLGRDVELSRLDTMLQEAASGSGACLLIAGEPGIGKSTLARCAADAAAKLGLDSYWGYTWEAGGAPAYWPWTELFDSLLADRSDIVADDLSGVLTTRTSAETGTSLPPEQARFQLYSAVRRLLAETSAERPCVLILEDLHAADTDSLNLLLYLCRQVQQLPILLLGTFREMEARSRSTAAPLWQAARTAEVLRPGRLDRETIARYVIAHTHRTLSRPELETLAAVTEGNPLFLTELVGLLSASHPRDGQLPETIGQVMRQQVERLPPETATLLPAAAVLGRTFSTQELAHLVQRPATAMQAGLAAATEAGLLEPDGIDRYRFYHALCVDALLQRLAPPARERLHARHASFLEEEVGGGRIERTAELASHLSQAGIGRRTAAVAAWRAAAERAKERLAFDEAARSMARALECFGDGPLFPPEDRCRLLLELAHAELTKGDIQAGHAHCREAFDFARTVGDARLMAEAALTYGSAIVVARVDAFLVQALEASLAALPADDLSIRARVQARLAAAKQPAPRPLEPVAMARDAIALARTTGDERVIFEVLRSAVSAMMDFAPAAERAPLNREYGELAARFGNVPEQFRAVLRLVMDACELGDRALLEESVRAVEQLAERIDLPHYGWRAASLRALLATIEGEFAIAIRHLDQARELAGEAEDDSARITLPLQRLMVLLEWADASAEEMERFSSDLEAALGMFPDAELYVRPLFLAFQDPEQVAGMLVNDALVERIFLGGDRFTLCLLGELSARLGNRQVLARAYEQLQPFANQCATLGLMGSAWYGPVGYSLALMAEALGDLKAARAHAHTALTICRNMRAVAAAARTHLALARWSAAEGDDAAAAAHRREAAALQTRYGLKPDRSLVEPVAPAPAKASNAAAANTAATPAPDFELRRVGEVWQVQFEGKAVILRPSKGLEMLSMLVSRPGRELHVLELTNPTPAGPIDPGDAGPALDDQARSAYRARVRALTDAIEDAETLGDTTAAEVAREELEFLSQELARAVGLKGRARTGAGAAERARVNVQRRLRDAIRKIASQHPKAGRYLENTVKTGSYCAYRPH